MTKHLYFSFLFSFWSLLFIQMQCCKAMPHFHTCTLQLSWESTWQYLLIFVAIYLDIAPSVTLVTLPQLMICCSGFSGAFWPSDCGFPLFVSTVSETCNNKILFNMFAAAFNVAVAFNAVFNDINKSWIQLFFHLIYFESFPSHSSPPWFSLTCDSVCVEDKKDRSWGRKHGGRHCLRPHLCVSPSGWQPCVRVPALFSRWPSKLLPGSLWSQRSLTKAGVLTAWGPAGSLLWLGLWGLWGLYGAPGSPSHDSQDNRSVLTQLPTLHLSAMVNTYISHHKYWCLVWTSWSHLSHHASIFLCKTLKFIRSTYNHSYKSGIYHKSKETIPPGYNCTITLYEAKALILHIKPPTYLRRAQTCKWINSIIGDKTSLRGEQKQLWQIYYPSTEGDLHV